MWPTQRGGYNITTPGDGSCYQRTPFCEWSPPVEPSDLNTYIRNLPGVVQLQQNLNHWNPSNPGRIDIQIANTSSPTSEDDFLTVGSFADFAGFEMVQSTTFKVTVMFPDVVCDHCVLRVRYISHNPLEIDPKNNTDAIFYNCADIAITVPPMHDVSTAEHLTEPAASRVLSSLEPSAPPLAQLSSTNTSCSTPDRWHASLVEVNQWGAVNHTIWWDAIQRLTRWDKSGALDASGSSDLSLVNDYNQPLEYVNFLSLGQCHIYGNDAWYFWECELLPFTFFTSPSQGM